MAEVMLPRLPSHGVDLLQVEAAAGLRSVGLRPCASAPEFHAVVEDARVDEKDSKKYRDALIQKNQIHALAAAWLPALRPLTGCTGMGKVNAFDASLVTTARSLGVLSRHFSNSSPSSMPTSSMPSSRSRRGSKTVGPGLQGLRGSASEPLLSCVVRQSRKPKQGERLMAGSVSMPVHLQNCRASESLQQLALESQRPEMKSGMARSSSGVSAFSPSSLAASALMMPSLDHENFLKTIERVDKSLAELRSGHDAFDPRQLGKSNAINATGGLDKSGKKNENDGDDEIDSRRERFEAYKMARRIEPELPPLSRHLEEELPPRTPREEGIMKRNASGPALHRWSISERKVRLEVQKEHRTERTQAVTSTRTQMLEDDFERYSTDLALKRRKAEATLKDQKKGGMHKPAKFLEFGEKWTTTVAAASFIEKCREALQAAKNKGQNHKRQQSTRSSLSLLGSSMAQEGDQGKVTGLVTMAFAMMQLKHKIRERRTQAKVICTALNGWKNGGRVVMSVRRMSHNIRKVQRWWRQCSGKLRDIREKVAARWEVLERAELLKEHARRQVGEPDPDDKTAKRGGVPRQKKKPHKADSGLTAEEYVYIWTVPPEVRDRFLDHELRARRYNLLPRISVWEEDCIAWEHHRKDAAADREALKMMANDAQDIPPMSAFLWPPVRPSYMPPAHPSFEANSSHCALSCCGRQGDQQIVEMSLRCRSAHQKRRAGGWIEIPKKTSNQARSESRASTFKSKSRRRSLGSLQDRSQASAEENPFGTEATDADMKEFCIDPDELPCLAEGAETPAPQSPC
mmetsp:Transcript_118359/g.379432  ORF Transcript_118359/g.379432 Transcript_118359/m.379432 type:complete len:801 (+) Transcript_118359:111-2513(+)